MSMLSWREIATAALTVSPIEAVDLLMLRAMLRLAKPRPWQKGNIGAALALTYLRRTTVHYCHENS